MAINMSDSIIPNSLDSGVLRTTRAFKKQLESPLSSENSNTSISSWSVLGALSLMRKLLREVCEEIGQDSVAVSLVEDDEFGWPRLSLRSVQGGSSGVALVVGAQDRRNGTILFIKLRPTELQLEMQEVEYKETETMQRNLRLFLRKFFDLITKKIEEDRTIDKQFSNLLNALDVPEDLIDRADIHGDDLFPSKIADPGDLEDDILPLEGDDFFK